MQQIDLKPLVIELDSLAGEADSKLFDTGKGNPSHPITLITLMLRQMRFTLLSGLYLNFGQESPPSDWAAEMTLSWPMLNRNLLDLLCNLVFILEEPHSRVPWFRKSGWRDAALNLQQLQGEYGTSMELKQRLEDLAKWVSIYADELGLSQDERNNPKKIPVWQTVGTMADYEIKANMKRPPQRDLIHFLYHWYFRQYSWTAHGQWYGLLRNGAILLRRNLLPAQREAVDHDLPVLQSIEIERAVLFFLSAVTEIDLHFMFGLAPKLFSLWSRILALPIVSAFEAAQIYEKGYKRREVFSVAERNGKLAYGFIGDPI